MIVHADALTHALELAPECDTLIVDPPYSEHVHANTASMGTAGAGPHVRPLGFTSLTPALQETIAACAAAVRRWSVVFTDLEGTYAWRHRCDFKGAEYVREVPWIRWSQPQLSGDRPPSGAEAVLHFHAQKIGGRGGRSPVAKRWNGPGSLTHYARRCLRGADKHPTEKPLDLMLDLVSWYSDPGETVFDPCAGAGTTALAARLLGRECVALELDATWAAHATARELDALSDRDRERATEWVTSTLNEAERVPAPKAADGSDVRTWERAQRRIADAARVAEWL